MRNSAIQNLVGRARQIGPTRAALLLAVAALAAGAVYAGLREAEVGTRAEAGATAAQEQPSPPPQDDREAPTDEETSEAEPLTLTLHAPETCETRDLGDAADGAWSHGLEWNEAEGQWEDLTADSWWYWDSVGVMEVQWTAAGGDGAYSVTIGGETYESASGAAWLRCAAHDEPEAGRSRMTVTAEVIDGSGEIAEASASVQVLSAGGGGLLLVAGETFLIKGWLVTIPYEFDMMLGDYEETICPPADGGEPVCESAFGLAVHTERYYAWLSIGEQSGAEGGRQIWLTDEDAPEAMALRDEVHMAFDRLIESLARPQQQGSG